LTNIKFEEKRAMKIYKRIAQTVLIGSLMSCSLQTAFADSFLGNRRDGGNVLVNYDASVASSGHTAIFDSARVNWSFISSKVTVAATSTLVSGYDRYFVGNTGTVGLLGRTTWYKKDATGAIVIAGVDDLWDHCTIAVYDNTMDANNMTNAQRVSNCTHEIGHSLKLAHPGQGTKRVAAVPAGRGAVMNQGIQDFGPQQYDKDELIYKWGS
jgi:hypothetical protein